MNKISKSGVNKIENCKPSFPLSFKVTSMGVYIIIILNVTGWFLWEADPETETAVWQVYKDVLPWSIPIDRNEECRDGQRGKGGYSAILTNATVKAMEKSGMTLQRCPVLLWGALAFLPWKWLEVCIYPVIFHEARLTSQGQFPERLRVYSCQQAAHSLRNWGEGGNP